MPVDCKRNRHKPRCKIVSLDLSEDHAWEVLRYIVETCDVAAVHFAPPCGTCSKARGIPMPAGSPGHQPVRSQEFLMGIPGISGLDQVNVDAANKLYLRMGLFIEWLHERGIAWVVENPTNSFLWELPYFHFAVEHGFFAHCHACASGGTRPKKTSFLSNKRNISLMQLFCEDVEPHHLEPWGTHSPRVLPLLWRPSILLACASSWFAFWMRFVWSWGLRFRQPITSLQGPKNSHEGGLLPNLFLSI